MTALGGLNGRRLAHKSTAMRTSKISSHLTKAAFENSQSCSPSVGFSSSRGGKTIFEPARWKYATFNSKQQAFENRDTRENCELGAAKWESASAESRATTNHIRSHSVGLSANKSSIKKTRWHASLWELEMGIGRAGSLIPRRERTDPSRVESRQVKWNEMRWDKASRYVQGSQVARCDMQTWTQIHKWSYQIRAVR